MSILPNAQACNWYAELCSLLSFLTCVPTIHPWVACAGELTSPVFTVVYCPCFVVFKKQTDYVNKTKSLTASLSLKASIFLVSELQLKRPAYNWIALTSNILE